ncbi:MAG TPA: OmpH family outer membrane protein [Nitrospiraceae bacterium]|nr:OmpH family outer membrane protein [Nitrospiraceae bacterium]
MFIGLAALWLCASCAGKERSVQSNESNQQGPSVHSSAPSRPSTQVGVVDLQRVLLDTESGKRAREVLSNFMKNRQAVIELEEKELKRMEEDLVKQASVLSAGGRKDREDLLRRRVAEFQQRATEMNREVQDKQKEVLEGFREKAERVVAKVAQQLGLLVVMEKGKGGPTVYSDATLDISARVIDEFNKEKDTP